MCASTSTIAILPSASVFPTRIRTPALEVMISSATYALLQNGDDTLFPTFAQEMAEIPANAVANHCHCSYDFDVFGLQN